MSLPRLLRVSALAASAALSAGAGCRSSGAPAVCDPEYAAVVQAHYESRSAADPVARAVAPVIEDLSGPHPVEVYIARALGQNPRVHAARLRVEAQAMRVPQAASLEDPMLGTTVWPFYPYVPQTAAGRVTHGLEASQKVPWPGKLHAEAAMAEAEADVARAELAAAELEVIEQVKRAYYELYVLQQTIELTHRSRDLLLNFADIADVRYRVGQVSQQDLLRAQVEVAQVDLELVQFRQELVGTQARLCRLMHVSPDTAPLAETDLPPRDVPRDLERLYRQAVAARPELHAHLAALERDHTRVERARLEYLPDVTASLGWEAMTRDRALAPTSDGIDMVSLGAMINVPIYRRRLDAGLREAELRAVATAREYDALKDETQADVKDLFTQARTQQELLDLFRAEILTRSRHTLDVSTEAYEAGTTDFLQLIDNWRQLLRFEISVERLEGQLRQTLASLERVVGGELLLIEAEAAAAGEPTESDEVVPPAPGEAERPPDEADPPLSPVAPRSSFRWRWLR